MEIKQIIGLLMLLIPSSGIVVMVTWGWVRQYGLLVTILVWLLVVVTTVLLVGGAHLITS